MARFNTLKEIYEHVRPRLLAQGERSEIDGACLYTSDDGRRHCAIGWLLEGLDTSEIEWRDLDSVETREFLLTHDVLPEENVDEWCEDTHGPLWELQGVHDLEEPEDWPEQLAFWASRWLAEPTT